MTRAGSGGPVSIIDWVPFVRFHGITYLRISTPGRPLRPGDLGPRYAGVRFKVADVVHDPAYKLKDGDAAFLAIGTPMLRMKSYASSFRLAARTRTGIDLFEADTNPRAGHGGDLLGIDGKVRAIGVNSASDGKRLATIVAPSAVTTLVSAILRSPVDQTRMATAGPSYSLVFLLADGTQVTRAYWPASGELERGIMVPPAVGDAVRRAIGQ